MSISFDKVTFHYPKASLLMDSFSMQVEAGDFVAIVGPSGIGKSTLMGLCLSLLDPQDGVIRLNDHTPAQALAEGSTAAMFQQPALLPWMTVGENVRFPFAATGKPVPERELCDLLDQVGLGTSEHLRPAELSGGMQTRVALVRALGQRPEYLFLDEPFTGLDQVSREELAELVVNLWSTREHTTLMVTHDINEAVYMADHVFVLGSHPISIKLGVEIKLQRPRHAAIRQTQQFVDYVARIRQHITTCCLPRNGGDA